MLVSRRFRFGPSVRIAAILLSLVSLLALPGCWVQSINGLSEAELFGTDKDQTYDPGLLGTWAATGNDCTTTLSVTADDKQYHWKVTSEGKGCGREKNEPDYYEGQLFKLDDHKFLDLTARSQDVCAACLAVHWIFKIEAENNSLNLFAIDSDWLEKAKKEKSLTLATAHGGPDTLTASPKDLKEFCRRYADDEEVFKPDPDSTFERKQP